MKATLSIRGLYLYDSSLFENFSVPTTVDLSDGDFITTPQVVNTGLVKQTAVDYIINHCAEFEVLYSNPEVCKAAITNWSARNLAQWTRAARALAYKYIVIDNYGGHITQNEINTPQGSFQNVHKDQNSGTGKGYITHTYGKGFNEDDVVESGKTKTDNDVVITDTTDYGSDLSAEDKYKTVRSFTESKHGNLGVTKSQEMVEAELQLTIANNIYDMILASFKQEFCLLVY